MFTPNLTAQILASALLAQGSVPAAEVSIGGIAVGDSLSQVVAKLGEPSSKVQSLDYLDLHYEYPTMTVSFSEGVVAGLFTNRSGACTPGNLCPGDSIERMRLIYGEPLVSDRETGRFYEYYGDDLYCWLRIPADDSTVASISVACQP